MIPFWKFAIFGVLPDLWQDFFRWIQHWRFMLIEIAKWAIYLFNWISSVGVCDEKKLDSNGGSPFVCRKPAFFVSISALLAFFPSFWRTSLAFSFSLWKDSFFFWRTSLFLSRASKLRQSYSISSISTAISCNQNNFPFFFPNKTQNQLEVNDP